MPDIKYSEEFLAQQREVSAIRKDVSTAYDIIRDGLTRYKKKILHARSKKQTEDMSMFAELDGYSGKKDIQDAYGYEMITYKQMERLNDLWDVREQVVSNQGKFSDRVTEMLERAMANCGDMFSDTLYEFDELVRRDNERSVQIERENSNNIYNRNHSGIKNN
jgi:hypothetical protein